MQLRARLVHAEPGQRVVQVSAWQRESCLGSALGEAVDAEQAEERALARLLQRLEGPPGAGAVTDAAATGAVTGAADATAGRAVRRVGPGPAAPPGPAGSGPEDSAAAAPEAPRQPSLELQPAPAAADPPGASAPPPPPATQPASGPPPPLEPPPADPDDWSDELAALDLQLQRLGWRRDQEATYLERAFGHPSRSRLTTYRDLSAYLRALGQLPPGADPAGAPVPLRRGDLLSQSDQLLQQLGWDAARGRRFLEGQFQLASRQQLSDEQLLHFNMLLESELLALPPPPLTAKATTAASAQPQGQP